MNIALFLTRELDPNAGGVQRTTSKLAKIFEAKKHKVIIVSYINTDARFCVRYQRERYGVEYPLLKLPPFTKVAKKWHKYKLST
jgi:hypothetical protein